MASTFKMLYFKDRNEANVLKRDKAGVLREV